MPRFEVEVLTTYADIVEIDAEDVEDARRKVRMGLGEMRGGTYSEGEVLDARQIRMDYDEALFDAFGAS